VEATEEAEDEGQPADAATDQEDSHRRPLASAESQEGVVKTSSLFLHHDFSTTAAWRPTFSIYAWNLAVRRRWPDAHQQVVSGGAVWWMGERIVGELKSRNGWPPRQGWVVEP
jgi:hypothetical protein